ncbi:hypothetical protein E4U15_000535 [Claviceps sp. LM218 group G6]|nr:hypothetical protein E4U15_000535 [Claviceps sp. LM218 group G6]
MLVGTIGARASLVGFAKPAKSLSWLSSIASSRMPWKLLEHRSSRIHVALRQLRCYAEASARRPPLMNEQQRRAKAASSKLIAERLEIPERLIIYHFGRVRVGVLAVLKLTSIFVSAFFTFFLVPSFVMADKPISETVTVAVAGMIPILFISYTTAAFVTHIHVHLPPAARVSRPVLERFVRTMPASLRLTITTVGPIGKPRYSSVTVGELRPVTGKRFGLVNYMRDTKLENATRKWYMYRAVGSFMVHEGLYKDRRFGKRGKVDGWIWDAVRGKIQSDKA